MTAAGWIRAAIAALRALALVAAVAAFAGAQTRTTSADLSGNIVDESSAVLRGATVTATNTASGIERFVATGGDGRYAIPALPPGTYVLTASLVGFVTERVEDLTLVLGQAAEQDFVLRMAPTSATVTVQADALRVPTVETALATTVSQRQIESLPVNVRNFLAFALTTPAVNTDRTPQQGPAATSGLTFAGQRARSNNITVDGLDNNDVATGAVRATFSQEAVEQFQVIATSYPAEFGKAAGAIVNIVTKSGTNRLAGNLFGFFRDEALNAREHFEKFNPAGERIDQGKAPYIQGQFGGTLGGPMRRNRSFFFLSAERLRIRANNFVTIDDATADVLQREGFPVELGQVPYRVETDQLLGKVDAALKVRHRATLRVNWANQLDENAEPWGGLIARSRGGYLRSRDLMAAASMTSVLSSRTVNEMRVQVANRSQGVFPLDPVGPAVTVGAVQVGRHGLTPQLRDSRLYEIVEAFSHAPGRHNFKTGLDASWLAQQYTSFPFYFGGRYVFPSTEALALGRPAFYMQGYGTPSLRHKWYSELSVFAQDDWRGSDRLTLELGVRYQNQFFPEITENVPGLPPYGWPADRNNVAPRLGVSWNPTGNGPTVVSGSYGIFYDNIVTSIWAVPFVFTRPIDPLRVRTLSAAGAAAVWQSPDRTAPEPSLPPSLLTTSDPGGLRTPYAHHVTIGLQRILRPGMTVSIHGVYVRGFDQPGLIEYNPVTRPPLGRPLDVNGVPGTSSSIGQYTSWAGSWYRGLTVSVRKWLGGRSEFLAAYTLSEAEDMATDFFGQPQDCGVGRNPADPTGLPLGFVPDSERARSLQDERHRFVVSGTYLLPGRFEISGIVSVGSGRPYNIIAGSDLNRDGDTYQSDRPWRVPQDTSTQIRRNAGRLPGTSTLDLRVARRLSLGRGVAVDLMVEMFNLLNHTNYTQVDARFGKGAYPNDPLPSFGRFTKAAPPFQAQLGARISFSR